MSTEIWNELNELRERAAPYIPLLPSGLLPESVVGSFQALVLSYYREHGRSFPWRDTTDPYAVVVSEVMLQQTQAHRVVEKYGEFLAAFPTFEELAAAPLRDVLAVWSGLGYNRRATGLKALAERVMSEHAGRLPDTPGELVRLPMIGKATAGSICAFAFDSPVVFIETNIRRVYIHSFFPDATAVDDRDIEPFVAQTLHRRSPRTWYNGLMDVGTALASRVPNPNRRSKHYTRQSPFEGSLRQVRGEILRILSREGEKGTDELARELPFDTRRVEEAVQHLAREGFLVLRRGRVGIRDD
jgi:A/G-specific adenine glycosylase